MELGETCVAGDLIVPLWSFKGFETKGLGSRTRRICPHRIDGCTVVEIERSTRSLHHTLAYHHPEVVHTTRVHSTELKGHITQGDRFRESINSTNSR